MINHITHTIAPIFNNESKVLILGSLPSPISREKGMFYMNPQNKFWKVIAKLFNEKEPTTNQERINILLKHKIAVWDVIKECDIVGASDNSIKNAVANDFSLIFNNANIQQVFTTGIKATKLYKKLTGNTSIYLPSTSPANCAVSLDNLVDEFSVILNYTTTSKKL